MLPRKEDISPSGHKGDELHYWDSCVILLLDFVAAHVLRVGGECANAVNVGFFVSLHKADYSTSFLIVMLYWKTITNSSMISKRP